MPPIKQKSSAFEIAVSTGCGSAASRPMVLAANLLAAREKWDFGGS